MTVFNIKEGIERIQALQARAQELFEQIDYLVQSKVQTLETQLQQIQSGSCSFAPAEDHVTRYFVDAFCIDQVRTFPQKHPRCETDKFDFVLKQMSRQKTKLLVAMDRDCSWQEFHIL
eukprot:g29305.t1